MVWQRLVCKGPVHNLSALLKFEWYPGYQVGIPSELCSVIGTRSTTRDRGATEPRLNFVPGTLGSDGPYPVPTAIRLGIPTRGTQDPPSCPRYPGNAFLKSNT
eukprot:1534388-Rhodomonas_salina.4